MCNGLSPPPCNNKQTPQHNNHRNVTTTPNNTPQQYDPRFPATNQARHCFVRYNEYHKCVYERGPDAERCAFYRRAYASMCPEEWVEEWQELRDKGLWMGKY